MGAIPVSNVDDAVQEMEHCKKLGLNGVALRAFPSNKSYPTLDDERFWAASLDLDMPVTIHVEADRIVIRRAGEDSANGDDPAVD